MPAMTSSSPRRVGRRPSLGLLTSNKETGSYELGTSVSLPYVEALVVKFCALD
jgi:hypothetical protein